jgi:hypothetical protein
MAKINYTSNPRVAEIFNDLEKFMVFCQDFGYRYNEADLYNWKSYAWQQHSKYAQGKVAKDMWTQDSGRRTWARPQ